MYQNIAEAIQNIAVSPVNSSFVQALGWASVQIATQPRKVSLLVVEMNGRRYGYRAVREVYRTIKGAESIGRAFNAAKASLGEAIRVA